MFSVGDEFNSFTELSTKIKEFEKETCTQLYVRSSRTIESTIKHAPKKLFNHDVRYSELDYAFIHGGKQFKSSSTGKRPNQTSVALLYFVSL